MQSINKSIEENKVKFLDELNQVKNAEDIQNINIKYFKKYTKSLYSDLKNVSETEEKKNIGKSINEFKEFIENNIEMALRKFKKENIANKYDVTIFKQNIKLGTVHPLVKLYKKMEKIFINMGFSIVQGPEIELDKYNFEKLNMPSHHPARDMQDTFYVSSPSILLRSHTSSVQIRAMQEKSPPIQIISPGTVYRVDDIDPQHTPMFYQVEGLMVGEKISFANLKAVLIKLLKEVFGSHVGVRFRPTYYPYTEPSAAIDMSCTKCNKKGCKTCSGTGWITVLGSGMVHPNVLEGVGYSSEKYTGFAFGLGLNRLALIYYDLGEIRKIYENDINLWKQL
ncbi:MAG: phenylalanine--tRNA ligase subunit alpha [Oscillospiraceae bacterium]|jgi:phenylalanyl-tRNA synthetase alpha chain|nr:phenylalanine--tRNA ligase subunit alpha [Oscillospiraceae bacterium]